MVNTKQYTLLQMFSIVGGRLSTKMDDVYDILGHICGDDGITTIGLTMVMDMLRENKPDWWDHIQVDIELVKRNAKSGSFEDVIQYIKEQYNPTYSIVGNSLKATT